jgi:hypothetical protein
MLLHVAVRTRRRHAIVVKVRKQPCRNLRCQRMNGSRGDAAADRFDMGSGRNARCAERRQQGQCEAGSHNGLIIYPNTSITGTWTVTPMLARQPRGTTAGEFNRKSRGVNVDRCR